MTKQQKQIRLGAHFPGVNNTTVWSDPAAGSHIAFDSFRRFARTAERGRFDFLFLAEGLRLREHQGRIHDLDVVGRPDTFAVLAALAGVTDHIGLAGTINATFNEPYDVARKFATLDHLSRGRAAWNVVTSSDAFTGENFRRGGYLDQSDRYTRAQSFVRAARTLWDSWADQDVVADHASGRFLGDPHAGAYAYRDRHFDIGGRFNVPRSPQGRPVIFQAGDSPEGRDFAAAEADAIFTRHSTLEAGQEFYRDVKRRLPQHGRSADDLLILPGVTFVIGDTDDDAQELAGVIRRQQVSGQTAINVLEDLGFEAIDNLPLSLIPRLLDGPPRPVPLALGLDVRNRDFSASNVIELIDSLTRNPRFAPEVLYLDSATDTLVRRYAETRRRHPLAADGSPTDAAATPWATSPMRGPPATTTMNTPCRRPRRWSGVADCRMVVRKSMDTESMTPAATRVAQASTRGQAVSDPAPPDARSTTAPNAMMHTAQPATAAAQARP